MKIIINNPVLKTKCKEVDLKKGKTIAKRMWQFLNLYNKKNEVKAVGLAANQFGIDASVAIVLKNNKPFILINPKIINFSQVKICKKEGCLSFPDEQLDVYRHMWIEVACLNHDGSIFFGSRPEESNDNFLESCVAQHEIAHLNGLTFHDFQWNNSITPNDW
jgi:peptide deformylase